MSVDLQALNFLSERLKADIPDRQDQTTPAQSLTQFKKLLSRQYQHPQHLELLDQHLLSVAQFVESVGKEGTGRLIIEMPPRHGKSLSVSRMFPAWFVGRNPDSRIMLVSYGQDLANKNSRAVRNYLRLDQYRKQFPHVRLSPESQAVNAWDIDGHDGGLDAIGITAGATGKGMHLGIIDDPVKSRAEAESKTYRERVWDTFTDDLYTRLEPGGAIILMMTRWHEDDLIGRALSQLKNENWTRLRLPALAEANDPIGRLPGQALWADRYPLERLESIRDALGMYSWSALYQQSPQPSGGGLFDTTKIQVYEYPPECKKIVRFYDLAVTAKSSSDYTAGVKLGVTDDERFIILDVYRAQKEFPEVHEAIVQNALIDDKSVRIRLEAEKAGIIGLDYLLRDKRMRPFTIDKKPPQGDKYTRALPFASRVDAGRVGIVRAAWNRAYLDELAAFPGGTHDDMVDATSGAYDMLTTRTAGAIPATPARIF